MVGSIVVAGKDSDLRYFSALLVLAVFAVPAVGAACLFSGECPMRVSDCHDEEGQQADPLCCEIEAAPVSKQQKVEADPSSVVLASWSRPLGVFGAAVQEPVPPPQSSAQFPGLAPLFVAHSSYLL